MMTGKRGPDFYDDPSVFEYYLSRRADPMSANETLEKPVLMELIGEMQGLKILDLGCGDAHIGREALQKGSSTYIGVDGWRTTTQWMSAEVIKYHRTIEDYFMGLREAGFRIDAVRESRPQPALFPDKEIYQRRKRIPLMLFFSACRTD